MSMPFTAHEQATNNSVCRLIMTVAGSVVTAGNWAYGQGYDARQRLHGAYTEQYDHLDSWDMCPGFRRWVAIAFTALLAVATVVNFVWVGAPRVAAWVDSFNADNAERWQFATLGMEPPAWVARVQTWFNEYRQDRNLLASVTDQTPETPVTAIRSESSADS